MIIIKTFFSIGIFLWAAAAVSAGNEGAHGGNVIVCPGKEVVTLDYFNATMDNVGGPANTIDISKMSFDEIFFFIRGRFDGSPFQNTFDAARSKFGPITSWPTADLKDVDDGGEPYLIPKACHRATAAVRQGNTIYIDPAMYKLLSESQRGLLYIHELLYYISGQQDSTHVRESLRVLLKQKIRQDDIVTAVELLGHYYGFEYLEPKSYFMPEPNSNQPLDEFMEIIAIEQATHIVSISEGGVALKFMNCTALTSCSFTDSNGFNCQVVIKDQNQFNVICPEYEKRVSRFIRMPTEKM